MSVGHHHHHHHHTRQGQRAETISAISDDASIWPVALDFAPLSACVSSVTDLQTSKQSTHTRSHTLPAQPQSGESGEKGAALIHPRLTLSTCTTAGHTMSMRSQTSARVTSSNTTLHHLVLITEMLCSSRSALDFS